MVGADGPLRDAWGVRGNEQDSVAIEPEGGRGFVSTFLLRLVLEAVEVVGRCFRVSFWRFLASFLTLRLLRVSGRPIR